MAKASPWMDRLAFVFSLLVVLGAGFWLWQRGTFNIHLAGENNLSWYLIRAAGLTSYILLTISVIWGLAVSSRIVKDWSPGVMSMLLHSTISWLAVIFALGHALLLTLDHYMPYTLSQLFVPFAGPYRPVAVGLGVIAFWVALVVSASFSVKKLMGHRAWKLLHYTSFVSFGLVTAHGLLAGTDANNLGFQILLAGSVTLVIVFLVYRIRQSKI
jgi:predicted ferric reductase